MSFDILAPHYRWLEFILAGDKLQRCRTAYIDRLSEARNILILGEGNGRFLAELCKRAQCARITCVDSSARMLALARSRSAGARNHKVELQFIHADALKWQPQTGYYDAIVTHFFLDCFPPDELAGLTARIGRAATRESSWLLADFQIPAHGWRRTRARAIHQLMYAFFRAFTRLPARAMTAPDGFLQQNGFCLRERRLSEWELLRSDLWSHA